MFSIVQWESVIFYETYLNLTLRNTSVSLLTCNNLITCTMIHLVQLSNDLSSLVWSTDKKSAQHLLHLPQEIFTDQINQAIVSTLMLEKQ